MDYRSKYIWYKNKYIELKTQKAGACIENRHYCGNDFKFFDTDNDKCCSKTKSGSCMGKCFYKISALYTNVDMKCDIFSDVTLTGTIVIGPPIFIITNPTNLDQLQVPKYIQINSLKFTNPTFINAGHYAAIVGYSDTDKHIALKIGRIDKDIAVLQKLKKTECGQIIVNSVLHEEKQENVVNRYLIMEKVNGTLYDIISLTNQDTLVSLMIVLNIIMQLTLMFKCLLQIDLVYTDIKLTNILYKCASKDHIKIMLGDLGSAVPKDQEGVATFPPFDKITDEGAIDNAEESDVIWGIGITIFYLLGYDIAAYFAWNTSASQNEIEKQLEILISNTEKKMYNNKLVSILRMTLNIDKKKRSSIKDVYDEIKKLYTNLAKEIAKVTEKR